MFRPGIFFDTFQESFRNKMFLFFFIVSSLVIGSIGLTLNMDAVNGVMRGATFFGNEIKLPAFNVKQWVENLQTGLAMVTGTFGLFLALLATSTLFPSMLQKGSIDLLLCRPIARWRLITARFLGGASIMAFNAAYLFLGAVDRARTEIRRLESGLSALVDPGDFRLRGHVFCGDGRVGHNGERAGRASGFVRDVDLQSDSGSAREDYACVFVGTLQAGFPFDVLAVAEAG
jgi:hypothetical protein